MASSPPARRAFTIVELLVVIGVLVLLISIFIPYLAKTREVDNRARCARNLANFAMLFREYAIREENAHGTPLLPSVISAGHTRPNGYTAFPGPDDLTPFAPANATTTQATVGQVAPHDVTASLFLLMRYGYISNG